MFKFGIIIEARLASTRLPNKVIKKVKNFTLIEFLITRLKSLDIPIILATSKNKENGKLVNLAKKNNINFYRGSEHNVLSRVLGAAKKFKILNIISITGDCPLVCPDIILNLINFYNKNDKYVDYVSIKNFIGGMDTQIYKTKTLEKSYSLCKSKLNKEHVTLFIRNSNKFKKKYLINRKNVILKKKWVLVVDEKKDFMLIKKIVAHFIKENFYFRYNDLVSFLIKNENLHKINNKVKRKGDS